MTVKQLTKIALMSASMVCVFQIFSNILYLYYRIIRNDLKQKGSDIVLCDFCLFKYAVSRDHPLDLYVSYDLSVVCLSCSAF